jgi:hypothetical protein
MEIEGVALIDDERCARVRCPAAASCPRVPLVALQEGQQLNALLHCAYLNRLRDGCCALLQGRISRTLTGVFTSFTLVFRSLRPGIAICTPPYVITLVVLVAAAAPPDSLFILYRGDELEYSRSDRNVCISRWIMVHYDAHSFHLQHKELVSSFFLGLCSASGSTRAKSSDFFRVWVGRKLMVGMLDS